MHDNIYKRFVVHVYSISMGRKTHEYDDLDQANIFMDKEFKKSSVYKVKLWDLFLGEIEPNNPKAIALLKELC